MTECPRDGSEIELLIRHANFPREKEDSRHRWEEIVRGHWIDFNGGGFTWFGMCGSAWAWRPLSPSAPVTLNG